MVYIILLIINILFVYFIKSDKKFWLLSIPLWTVLLLSLICWRIYNDNQINKLETEYWKTTENKGYGDYNKRNKLEKAEKNAQKINTTFIYLIGLQTLVTFIFQIAGQRQTKKITYNWTKIIFGILFVLILFLLLLMAIVPSGGYVT